MTASWSRMPAVDSTCSPGSHLEGQFGDMHRTVRTEGSSLYINPLMTLYFGFELEAVAGRVSYLHLLKHTRDSFDVSMIIAKFRAEINRKIRSEVTIPM